jgi:hypothetical protein
MSNKDLLKQAIAEAKTIREAAIANAKEALEESLTPHLKEMLAQKLQEMEEDEHEFGTHIDGSPLEDPKKNMTLEEEESTEEEEPTEEEGNEEETEEEDVDVKDMSVEELKDLIRDIVSQEVGEGESEEEMPGEEAPEGEDLTGMDSEEEEIDINELLAELAQEETVSEGFEEWLDRTSAQMKKFGEENPAIQAIEKAIAAAQEKAKKAGLTGHGMTKGHRISEQKENLEEGFEEWLDRTSAQMEKFGKENPAIQAIERAITAAQKKAKDLGLTGHGMTKGHKISEAENLEEGFEEWLDRTSAQMEKFGKENPAIQAIEKAIAAAQEKFKKAGLNSPLGGSKAFQESADLNEALKTIKVLRSQLQEVNLLNAKLLYVNKVFKANNLSESQKVNVVAAFDKAETVKEVKLVFETVSKNVVNKPATIKEHKSFASKAAGTSQTAGRQEIISEVSDTVKRMQKLAGIIK